MFYVCPNTWKAFHITAANSLMEITLPFHIGSVTGGEGTDQCQRQALRIKLDYVKLFTIAVEARNLGRNKQFVFTCVICFYIHTLM